MLEEKSVDLLNKFEVLTNQFAPDVIDAALEVTHFRGVVNVATGFMLLLLASIVAKIAMNVFRAIGRIEGDGTAWDMWSGSVIAIGGCAVIVISVIGLYHVLNVWNWVAIFNPELALAEAVLGLR